MRIEAALLVVLACSVLGSAQDDPTRKLDVFLGKWQSEGAFFDTTFSQTGKVSSSIECRRSPQANFLLCEQQITKSDGKSIQLSIYSYNAKDGNYTISSMTGPGTQPFNGTVIIAGKIWTYPGGFEQDGKKIKITTTNAFSVPGSDVFNTEVSEPGRAQSTVS